MYDKEKIIIIHLFVFVLSYKIFSSIYIKDMVHYKVMRKVLTVIQYMRRTGVGQKYRKGEYYRIKAYQPYL